MFRAGVHNPGLSIFVRRAYYPAPMPFRIPLNDLLHFQAQRICLIKPSALGDVVQTLPLLGMLRHRFPTATISWVVRRSLSDVLLGHPDLTEIIPFHRRGKGLDSGVSWGCSTIAALILFSICRDF